jgi:hypothetical protein
MSILEGLTLVATTVAAAFAYRTFKTSAATVSVASALSQEYRSVMDEAVARFQSLDQSVDARLRADHLILAKSVAKFEEIENRFNRGRLPIVHGGFGFIGNGFPDSFNLFDYHSVSLGFQLTNN